MRTILAAKETVAQLWGYPKPKDTSYRLMKYLLQVEVEEGVLLHNVVTGHLILLSKEEAELLSHLPAKPTEFIEDLISSHFLVPETFNEYRSVNQLRSICQKRSTGNAINHYVILPTSFCNARCFYCYESDYPRIHMTEETGEKIINYIDEHRNGKSVSIQWFGGEPLVGIARIDQISQGLKDRDIPFLTTMISNGYLFDQEIVDRSVKLWNLKRIQITLDGTEEVYNRVKAYAGVKDNPFQRVLRNIDMLSANSIHVNIRLNMDFYNKDNIRVLIEELGERYSGNNYVTVYLNMLFNNQGYTPVIHSEDEIVELMNIISDYTARLKELQVAFDNHLKGLSLQFIQCMADNPHSVLIQPDGSFCRCEHENVHDSYGDIERGVIDSQKLIKWREAVEHSPYCPDCSLYPACYQLRHCISGDLPCIESFRMNSQKKQEERIRAVYIHGMEDEKNESICST